MLTSRTAAKLAMQLSAHSEIDIMSDGPSGAAARGQIVGGVAELRHAGEMKAYIDLLFLALVILLCTPRSSPAERNRGALARRVGFLADGALDVLPVVNGPLRRGRHPG